jgi:hypothetical protein
MRSEDEDDEDEYDEEDEVGLAVFRLFPPLGFDNAWVKDVNDRMSSMIIVRMV